MKKIMFLLAILVIFFSAPLFFKGASACSGTCTYFVPRCDGYKLPEFSNYTDYSGSKVMSAVPYSNFLASEDYSGTSLAYITTTSSGQKRISGVYFFFTLKKDFSINDPVLFYQEQWSDYEVDAGYVSAYKLSSNSPQFLDEIKYSPIIIKDFLSDKCDCPKIYIQNYCLLEKGTSFPTPGPIVLEKYIDNIDAIYHGMTLISEESNLEKIEIISDSTDSEVISNVEVEKHVYSTNDQIIFSHGEGYDLAWHIQIEKTYDPLLFSGKFVAVLKKHGQYYETDKVTHYTGIDLRAIDNQDLNDPKSFKTKATITDDKLIACIDRALHPEKYNNYYDDLYKTKCELSKITKDTDTFFSINWDDIQLYNTEGQPIKCSDFDLDNGENLVKMLFTIIKIIAPVLVIVFGSLDFAKAIFQADEEKQKKAGQDFIKRLIAAALIFLIPTILEIILGVAFNWDEAIPSICVK